ncbi:MAG: DHHA1 domain-containing protein [Candidatus Asgardarchaeia archaeon]
MSEAARFVKFAREAASRLGELISENKYFVIFSHHDADGLSSAGIMGSALYREGARFQIRIFRQLERKYIKEVKAFDKDDNVLLFLDFGSGQYNILMDELKNSTYFILDHHEVVSEEYENGRCFQLNPHMFSIDGSEMISGAGVSYLVSKFLNYPKNKDLSYLAIVGALGDRQDKGKQRSLIGLNYSLILQDALEVGVIESHKDFLFFGRETRPIHISIEYSTDPYIPGISGNRNKVLEILKNSKIELKDENGRWRTLSNLNEEEKGVLFSEIVKHISMNGLPTDYAKSLIGTVYTVSLEKEGTPLRDAREFATLLNSCGRMRKYDVALAVVLGDRNRSLKEAMNVYEEYKRKISEALKWLYDNRENITNYSHIQVLYGRDRIDETIIGTVASIALSSRFVPETKPLIALADSDEKDLKVSARASKTSLKMGVNLSDAIRETLKELGIEETGGGHKMAAGAKIPKYLMEKFLLKLNDKIRIQIEGENDKITHDISSLT